MGGLVSIQGNEMARSWHDDHHVLDLSNGLLDKRSWALRHITMPSPVLLTIAAHGSKFSISIVISVVVHVSLK